MRAGENRDVRVWAEADISPSRETADLARKAGERGNQVRCCGKENDSIGLQNHSPPDQCTVQRKFKQPRTDSDRPDPSLKTREEHREREQHVCRDIGAVSGATRHDGREDCGSGDDGAYAGSHQCAERSPAGYRVGLIHQRKLLQRVNIRNWRQAPKPYRRGA